MHANMKLMNSQLKCLSQEVNSQKHAIEDAQKEAFSVKLDLNVLKTKYAQAIKKIDYLTKILEEDNIIAIVGFVERYNLALDHVFILNLEFDFSTLNVFKRVDNSSKESKVLYTPQCHSKNDIFINKSQRIINEWKYTCKNMLCSHFM